MNLKDKKMKDGLLDYSRGIILKDAVISIFKSYIKAYSIETEITDEMFDYMVEKFIEVYQTYVIHTFEDLDIRTVEVNNIKYLGVDELMHKVSGLAASKLAAEILLLGFILKDKNYD